MSRQEHGHGADRVGLQVPGRGRRRLRVEPEARTHAAAAREDGRARLGNDGARRQDDAAGARPSTCPSPTRTSARRAAARATTSRRSAGSSPSRTTAPGRSRRFAGSSSTSTGRRSRPRGRARRWRAGDVVVTPRGGQAVLRAAAGDGTTTIAGGSELKVDAKHCPGKSGWKLGLEAGGLTAAVPKGAAAKASFTTATKNATSPAAPARAGRWSTPSGGRRFARWPARFVSAGKC